MILIGALIETIFDVDLDFGYSGPENILAFILAIASTIGFIIITGNNPRLRINSDVNGRSVTDFKEDLSLPD